MEQKPLFDEYWIKVFPTHVSYQYKVFGLLMKDISIPINEISSIDLGSIYSLHVKIETSGGKKYEFPLRHDRREKLRDAIFQAKQSSKT